MSPELVMRRFRAAVERDEQLAPLMGMVAPYLAMLGDPSAVVALLERLYQAYHMAAYTEERL